MNLMVLSKGMKYITTVIVVLSLSCGVTAQLPQVPISDTMSKPAITSEPIDHFVERNNMEVCADRVNFRTGAGTGNAVLLRDGLQRDTIVTLTGEQETPENGIFPWYKITVIVDGKEYTGWINSRYLCN